MGGGRESLGRQSRLRRADSGAPAKRPIARWQWAWLFAALVSAAPVSYHAYQALQENGRAARMQLIERYSLWESDAQSRASPQAWTRFAARLLNTAQLMQRVREKHGALADQIEQDFEFDTALSHSRIVAVYLAAWGVPLGVLYGVGWLAARRRRGQP